MASTTRSTTSSASSSSSVSKIAMESKNPLFILYGSATGNAEHIAKELETKYREEYLSSSSSLVAEDNNNNNNNSVIFDNVICIEMDQFKKVCLPRWESGDDDSCNKYSSKQYYGVLIVTSTTGNGDAPENASRFVRYIRRKQTAESLSLQRCIYAVLGLGDTNYDQFCNCGKMIDRRMNECGAIRFRTIACADEATGLEDVVEPWIDTILNDVMKAVQQKQNQNDSHNNMNNNNSSGISSSSSIDGDSLVQNQKGSCASSSSVAANENNKEKENGNNNNHGNNSITKTTMTMTKLPTNGTTTTTTTTTKTTIDNDRNIINNSKNDDDDNSSTSMGVRTVRFLLGLQSDDDTATGVPPDNDNDVDVIDKNNNNNNNDDDVLFNKNNINIEVLTTTNDITTTTTTSSSSSNEQQQQQQHDNNDDDHDDDDESYYSYNRPYQSTILNARYLTQQTSTDAAAKVIQQQQQQARRTNNNKDDTTTLMKRMSDIYDEHFPLLLLSSKSSSSSSSNDNPDETTNTTNTIMRNGKRVIELTLSLPTPQSQHQQPKQQQNGNNNNNNSNNVSEEDTRSLFHYQPGDSIGMIVENEIHHVDYVLDMLCKHNSNIQRHSMIRIKQQQQDSQEEEVNNDNISDNVKINIMSLEQFLRTKIDLSTPIRQPRVLRTLLPYVTNKQEKQILTMLANTTTTTTTTATSIFDQYIIQQRLCIVDIFDEFPSLQKNIMTLNTLFKCVQPNILPRYYSICSSSLTSTTTTTTTTIQQQPSLKIAFSVVDYITPSLLIRTKTNDSSSSSIDRGSRRIRGIATRYLEMISSSLFVVAGTGTASSSSSLVPSCNSNSTTSTTVPFISIFPKPSINGFHPPTSLSVPIILIGPGTGIAPFIGFLQHRQEQIRITQQQQQQQEEERHSVTTTTTITGTSTIGTVDVYFGCRHQDHDYIYKDEMNQYVNDGIITNLRTVFSRDYNQSSRIKYVQDLIRQDEERFCHQLIIKQNAMVYICGDGNDMAKDVQNTIKELLMKHITASGSNGQTQHSNTNTNANGHVKEDAAAAAAAQQYLDTMKNDGRLLLDIWT